MKDGEIKILRKNLSEKSKEVSTVKDEKFKVIEQHKKEQKVKEKTMESDIMRIGNELKFKEQELASMKTQYQMLESKLRQYIDEPSSNSESPSKSQSTYHSPRMRKVQTKSPAGSKSGFPTSKSFLADDSFCHKSTPPTTSGSNITPRTVTTDAGLYELEFVTYMYF